LTPISRALHLAKEAWTTVLRWEKTVVIPVIAKADTLTVKHMAHLKRAVWKSIRDNSMNPLDALELEDDEEEADGGDSNVLVEEDEDADFDPPNQSPNRLSSSSRSFKSSSSGAKVKSSSKRASHIRHASQAAATTDEEPYLPLSVLSPDPYTQPTASSRACSRGVLLHL
jgi:hypothetical protein